MDRKKSECSIVKDLLPNYIENLLSNDSREFVNSHINNCDECKNTLDVMQNNIGIEYNKDNKEQKIEINHLKKYKRKRLLLKTITFFIIGIIILIVIILLIKCNCITSIINNSYQKKEELKELSNYRLYTTEHFINYNTNEEYFRDNNYYYKDGKYKISFKSEATHTEILNSNRTYYGIVDSNEQIQVSEDERKVYNVVANYNIFPKGKMFNTMYTYLENYTKNYGFIVNTALKSTFKVRTDRLNGVECYVLRREDSSCYHELWIAKENQILIKEVDEIYNVQYIEKNYLLYVDVVTDEEIEFTEWEGYIMEDINETAEEYAIKIFESIN